MTALVHLLVVVAALKCAIAIGVSVARTGGLADPLLYSPYQYAILVLAFGATGATLIAARTTDRRPLWLGCILLLTATPFADPLLACCAGAAPALTTMAALLVRTQVVALLPVFFWLFVRHFPDVTVSRVGTRVQKIATRASLAVAVLLMTSNLSEYFWPLKGSTVQADFRSLLSRQSVQSLYWPLVIGLSLPGLPFMAWKARAAPISDRRRVRVFVTGLLLGFAPVSIEVLLEAISPAYSRHVTGSAAGGWIARLIFMSLVAVPLVTAYSVMIDRVVEIRLVLRSALQYALAKYTLLAMIGVPLIGIVWYLYRHRDQTVLHLLSGSRPLVLAATVVAAGVILQIRHRALNALDRRFFREQYDARQILNELAEQCRKATTIDELVTLVCREVDRALHLDYVTMLVATADGKSLRSPDRRIRPLGRSSGLALLVAGDTTPLVIDLESVDSTLRRLPEEERNWLGDSRLGLLVPLNAGDGSLQGLIGLGHKRSELPFSREDRLLLETIGASVALTLENRRLRESASPVRNSGRPASPQPERWSDDGRPAAECERCGRVHPPDAPICTCGSQLEPSIVPYVLAGKFQFERRLGRGGMGVVYRALDLDLGRHVAIKTLPRVGPEDASRLRREAKAMAAVQHENLAVIFGAETWLGTPMLVVELLASGTLAATLRGGPLPCARTLDIGISLAKGVEHLHEGGILHCDIKPSNIGFTGKDVPKLLDFGLARILRDGLTAGDSTTRSAIDRPGVATVQRASDTRAFAGTPLYMSPEAIEGQAPGPAFDVWSLTVVLFEAIAGTPPFRGGSVMAITDAVRRGELPDIRTFCATCPPSVASFFNRALSRRIADRPTTAAQLFAALIRLRDGLNPG
jgi:GAF domain-containing protein